jgi:UDP-glucose 6-dehydrogenase
MREGRSIADVLRPSRIVLGVQPGGRAKPVRQVWTEPLAGLEVDVSCIIRNTYYREVQE